MAADVSGTVPPARFNKCYSRIATLSILLAAVAFVGSLFVTAPPERQLPAEPGAIVAAIHDHRYSGASIRRAIEAYGNVDAVNEVTNESFVAAAALLDRRELLVWLLASGAEPNPRGVNPLQGCIAQGNRDAAVILLRAGADWSRVGESGKTVLAFAREINPDFLDEIRSVDASLVPSVEPPTSKNASGDR